MLLTSSSTSARLWYTVVRAHRSKEETSSEPSAAQSAIATHKALWPGQSLSRGLCSVLHVPVPGAASMFHTIVAAHSKHAVGYTNYPQSQNSPTPACAADALPSRPSPAESPYLFYFFPAALRKSFLRRASMYGERALQRTYLFLQPALIDIYAWDGGAMSCLCGQGFSWL